ncbi:MAG: pilus assembly protein TadG-related protein [Caldimonas sp.]|uniref:pilus assembly protein TadG-related protein n=1 Tax=Caldimonas sp. TaxID=2838790 RepID=UPI00391B9E88
MRHRHAPPGFARRPARQRGVVAIIVGLAIAVLLGFAGLALDGGRLYINKTELQNAADACALAASRELTCDPAVASCGTSHLEAAQAAGIAVAARNVNDFQRNTVAIAPADVRFHTELAPNEAYRSIAEGADPASRYVMCIARQEGLLPWFMQVLGLGAQTVGAHAVATLAPAQTNCGIPLAMCSQGPATASPPFGLVPGRWYDGRFDAGGGLTGNFNWIDFTPPAGGQSELAALLTGSGVCNMNVPNPVGQTGVLGNAAARAWNSRFGLYQSGPTNLNTAPPDRTGYAYTNVNWDAAAGNALGDFLSRRATGDNYGSTVQAGNTLTGLSISNAYNPTTTPAQHLASGADRRLVTAPIVNCGEWAGSNTVPIRAWACVLMLHPIGHPSDIVYMEYLGLSSDPASPCATSGSVGGPGSVGPLVPALVQ